MTPETDDELDRLARALRTAPPPDADAKAAALRLAMENFDRLQGSAAPLRPIPESRKGFWSGVDIMLDFLTSRGALAATTSVAALCLGVVITLPVLQDGTRPGLSDRPPEVPLTLDPVAQSTRTEAPTTDAEARTDAAATLERDASGGQASVVPDLRSRVAGADDPVDAPVMEPEAAPGAMADLALPSVAAPAPSRQPLAVGRSMKSVAEGDAFAAAPAEMVAGAIAPPPPDDTIRQRTDDTEAFPEAEANPVKVTAEAPVSTFSVDVDTASYAIVRSSLMAGYLPDAAEVRIEEMVNYFPYAYPAPTADEAPFKATVTVMPAPWNEGRRLVQIGLQGRLPAIADRPPLNLVLLIDTSGSMEDPNKLPLLKQSLGLLLPELRPEDQVAIVAYAGSAGEVLAPTPAGDRAAIMGALDRLAAGGSTAGAEGLELAYRVADRMAGDGEVSRILLATDGDFNVGVDDPEGLEAYVAKKRETGTYLSILGFGRGNLDDATMQALAQAGNGTAAYIDTLNEARKVLVDQLSGALFPIADDVKIQVEWNPATVAEYRLIGYETRALAREDFSNDRVDAGEIGAGHSVTAIYEITAPDSPALAMDPLRYGAATAAGPAGELGFLRLRYKDPGEDASQLIEVPITPEMAPLGDEARFAAAIAGMGQLLTGAKYLGDWGWDEAIALALSGRGDDPFGYRAEAVNLMRLAQSLSR